MLDITRGLAYPQLQPENLKNLVEAAQDLTTNILSPILLMTHDASRGGQ